MAYGTPANPVGGTVITVAYATANILDPIRWLRLLTGNADPPGTNYVVVSTSTSGTVWAKLSGDTFAPGAVVAHLGYTPLKNTTDTLTGTLTVTGLSAGASGVLSGTGGFNTITGPYQGGLLLSGIINLLGLNVGTTGIASGGPIAGTSVAATNAITAGTSITAGTTVSATGAISSSAGLSGTTGAFSSTVTAGAYAGGSTTVGEPDFLGVTVGLNGIGSSGAIASSAGVSGTTSTFTSYHGGSTSAGEPDFLGVTVGANGIGSSGAIASLAGVSGTTGSFSSAVSGTSGTFSGAMSAASYAGGSTSTGEPDFLGVTVGANGINSTGAVNSSAGVTGTTGVFSVGVFIGSDEVYWPGNPAPLGSGAAVPSGLIGLFRTAAAIASGWARETDLDGRIAVGAGTTFTVTYVEATNYGAGWSHTHTDSGHAHSGSSLGVSGVTGAPSGTSTRADGANAVASADHTHDQGTLDVSGNTANGTAVISSDAWVIPSRAYVYARKT